MEPNQEGLVRKPCWMLSGIWIGNLPILLSSPVSYSSCFFAYQYTWLWIKINHSKLTGFGFSKIFKIISLVVALFQIQIFFCVHVASVLWVLTLLMGLCRITWYKSRHFATDTTKSIFSRFSPLSWVSLF